MRVAAVKGYDPMRVQSAYAAGIQNPEELIVMPRYDRYLATHSDAYFSPLIGDRINELLTTKPRDRRHSFSASSAGLCMRRQELAFIGARKIPMTDPKGARIFLNGTFVHLRWQATLLDAGIVDGVEITVKHSSLPARAALDGVGEVRGGRWDGLNFGLELKGRNSFAFRSQVAKGSPDEKTQDQVAFQHWLTGFEVITVVNECKDTQQVSEFPIAYDGVRVARVRREVEEMVSAVEQKRLHPMLPECVRQNRTGEFFKCPFGTPGGACVNSGSWPTKL